ncbi:MAG TPA: hypothetical protein VJ727_11960 [Rhodanobacteraceae bacterium]|nr:hypothetical protein [Rhodanobacteraceae bacterium]
MDSNKLTAIIGAVLIASGAVAGIRAWANASASETLIAPQAELEAIHTLPEITVRPTREQLEQLGMSHHAQPQAKAADAQTGGGVAMDMPYYSFGAAAMRASGS